MEPGARRPGSPARRAQARGARRPAARTAARVRRARAGRDRRRSGGRCARHPRRRGAGSRRHDDAARHPRGLDPAAPGVGSRDAHVRTRRPPRRRPRPPRRTRRRGRGSSRSPSRSTRPARPDGRVRAQATTASTRGACDPKVIVEHYTATTSFSSAWNTFASNAPDPELGELPGTCAHFVVDTTGRSTSSSR